MVFLAGNHSGSNLQLNHRKIMGKEYCPTCGTEVTIEGRTTLHYAPVKNSDETKKRAINFYNFVEKNYVLYPGGYVVKNPHYSTQQPDRKLCLDEIYDIYLNSL
jgi:hypothetical protein